MTLEEFGYFDRYKDWLGQIAAEADPEDWGPERTYLKYYCETNFILAYEQGLLHIDPQERFALWRVGHLRSRDGAPIYVLFVRNHVPDRQPWFFLAVLARRNPTVRLDAGRTRGAAQAIPVKPLPKEPVYEALHYEGGYMVEYNWQHFLEERQERIDFRLPGIDNERLLYLGIFGAVELAHRHYPKHAVVAFYRGRYQFLLPLYITTDDTALCPDLVAALDADPERGVYIVRTLLLPEWAYSNARAVALNPAPFRSWLSE